MLDLWFGLDASGFDRASTFLVPQKSEIHSLLLSAQFHRVFGPVLMVTYACLSNTLLLTGWSILRLVMATAR